MVKVIVGTLVVSQDPFPLSVCVENGQGSLRPVLIPSTPSPLNRRVVRQSLFKNFPFIHTVPYPDTHPSSFSLWYPSECTPTTYLCIRTSRRCIHTTSERWTSTRTCNPARYPVVLSTPRPDRSQVKVWGLTLVLYLCTRSVRESRILLCRLRRWEGSVVGGGGWLRTPWTSGGTTFRERQRVTGRRCGRLFYDYRYSFRLSRSNSTSSKYRDLLSFYPNYLR